MTKQEACHKLASKFKALAGLATAAANGGQLSLDTLRGMCSNRSYVGPQLEVGREELAVIFGDDDDDK